MKKPLYEGGGFKVTSNILKTWKHTYELKNVEMVSVRQPFLVLFGTIGVSIIGFTITFSRYLYFSEKLTLVAGSALAIFAASMFGSLKVQSLALREDQGQILGLIHHLRGVKNAVDTAMDQRSSPDT